MASSRPTVSSGGSPVSSGGSLVSSGGSLVSSGGSLVSSGGSLVSSGGSPGVSSPPLVLLADDSAVARLTVARRLRADGYEVLEQASAAPPGAEALARVSCALLDLDIGDGDGSELGRALLAQRADLPIAFFSGTASSVLLERARALGPVFAKPRELDAAVAWIRTSVRTSGPVRALESAPGPLPEVGGKPDP